MPVSFAVADSPASFSQIRQTSLVNPSLTGENSILNPDGVEPDSANGLALKAGFVPRSSVQESPFLSTQVVIGHVVVEPKKSLVAASWMTFQPPLS